VNTIPVIVFLKVFLPLSMQVAVEKFLTRTMELETRSGLSEADVLNLALLKDNLLTFRNGTGNSDRGPKGLVCYFCSCTARLMIVCRYCS